MFCDRQEILEKYRRSDWYTQLNMYCFYRDLRSEMIRIEKNQLEDNMSIERILADIDLA